MEGGSRRGPQRWIRDGQGSCGGEGRSHGPEQKEAGMIGANLGKGVGVRPIKAEMVG